MFEIDENNLPFVRTRQALLVLDLQNDFISPGCPLPVDTPSDFVEKILRLIPEFRVNGDIIWVLSCFAASRSINSPEIDSEKVITDNEVIAGRKSTSQGRQNSLRLSRDRNGKSSGISGRAAEIAAMMAKADNEDEEDEEAIADAFLTVMPGQRPRYVLPESAGANFSQAAGMGFNTDRDLWVQKTHYSAFKDGRLIQTLRAKFVTEIYICGALTNMSVFATAVDAARFGIAITLVEDCLGYRSKARHDEALRQLEVSTGCDTISSGELIDELRRKARGRERPQAQGRPHLRPKSERRTQAHDLESLMSKMNLKPDIPSSPPGPSASKSEAPSVPSTNVAVIETVSTSTSRSILVNESPNGHVSGTIPLTEGKKKERVPAKIKTRRRPSKPGSKDAMPTSQSSKTSTTLVAASQTSEKSPNSPNAAAELPKVSPSLAAMSGASRKAMSPDNLDIADQLSSLSVEEKSSEIPMTSTTSVANARVTERSAPTSNEQKSSLTSDEHLKPAKKIMTPETEESSVSTTKKQESIQVITPAHQTVSTPVRDETVPICEGDTKVISNLLNEDLAQQIFDTVRDEVRWQKMSHQGGDVPRLVAVQGEIAEDGSIPIYRHPADESPPLLPFSSAVSQIRAHVEKELGHSVNHVLIQFYRDGTDYISEHSDKTLDIVPKTFIANISLGAKRTMVFRTKRPPKSSDTPEVSEIIQIRQVCRAPLPHNSMCKMGLVTNMRWLHGIRQDKRMTSEKSEEELAFSGGRISLTFRLIGTFLDKDQQKIWGQGATSKTKDAARTVINGETPEAEKMIHAFGKENQSSEFDWEGSYGVGFDVLHMSNSAKLFLTGDSVVDMRVKLMLTEFDIAWTEGKLSPPFNWKDGSSSNNAPQIPESLPVRFVDNDLSKSTVTGDFAIMLYLDSVYGSKLDKAQTSQISLARQFTRFQQSDNLLNRWRANPFSATPFRRELELWEAFATEGPFIAGFNISLADYALWPILDQIYEEWPGLDGNKKLDAYYQRIKESEVVIKALGVKEKVEKES